MHKRGFPEKALFRLGAQRGWPKTSTEKPGYFVQKGEALFLQVLKMDVIHWFNVGFAAVNFSVDDVIFVAQFCEMGIAQTQFVNAIAPVRKLVDEFVRCVAQKFSPCCLLLTFDIIALDARARIDVSQKLAGEAIVQKFMRQGGIRGSISVYVATVPK